MNHPAFAPLRAFGIVEAPERRPRHHSIWLGARAYARKRPRPLVRTPLALVHTVAGGVFPNAAHHSDVFAMRRFPWGASPSPSPADAERIAVAEHRPRVTKSIRLSDESPANLPETGHGESQPGGLHGHAKAQLAGRRPGRIHLTRNAPPTPVEASPHRPSTLAG